MTTQDVLGLYQEYVIGSYARQPVVIARAAGSQMWDLDGKRYLDLFPGWGCSLLGYCHPRAGGSARACRQHLLHRRARSARADH